jgi:uncharacterized membrane protein
VLIGLLGWAIAAKYGMVTFLAVVGYGWWGMLLDSVLGAGLQARYRDAKGRLSDRPGPGYRLVGGWQYMTNDVVNLLAFTLTVLLAYSSSAV